MSQHDAPGSGKTKECASKGPSRFKAAARCQRPQDLPKRWILNIAFLINRRKVYWKYIFGKTMKRATQLFFLPGNLTANLLGATAADDRMMIRMLVDMLFWNLVVVAGAWMIFR